MTTAETITKCGAEPSKWRGIFAVVWRDPV